jgi:hypothetical protein
MDSPEAAYGGSQTTELGDRSLAPSGLARLPRWGLPRRGWRTQRKTISARSAPSHPSDGSDLSDPTDPAHLWGKSLSCRPLRPLCHFNTAPGAGLGLNGFCPAKTEGSGFTAGA